MNGQQRMNGVVPGLKSLGLIGGDVVWIIDWWLPLPVFHAYSGEVTTRHHEREKAEAGGYDPERGPHRRQRARCGIVLVNRDGGLVDADGVPARHAIKIGRPCENCFR